MNQGILKSSNDKNQYKALTLDNGLRVLLIQSHVDASSFEDPNTDDEQQDSEHESEDGNMEEANARAADDMETGSEDEMPEESESNKKKTLSSKKTKMAAAALCVSVGSFCDPPDLPGLAHFLEHMIYMGSEKYPEENHYDAFISKHGGSNNAFTDWERTVYFMEVTPKSFKEALDVFANCFISPLLKPDSMDREIEAIDSEFQMCAASDSERMEMVLQSVAKRPVSNFMCGNSLSLKEYPKGKNIDVNAALHQFQKQYYSAHHMTLTVQSAETLEVLEDWVRESFSLLPNNGLPALSFENVMEPYKTDAFYKLYKIVPIKRVHRISVTWALPPLLKHYRAKPLDYLSSLIGHEGKRSLLSLLKKRSWAVSLSAGNEESGSDMNSLLSLFCIEVTLTENGINRVYDVLTIIFQYILMLCQKGPQEHINKELEVIRNNVFRFEEQKDPIDNVGTIAEHMQLYPIEHYLAGSKLYFEYNPQLISDCIKYLKPELANIMILSTRNTEDECTEIEKWTQCKYSCQDIPKEWLNSWENLEENSDLHLPEPNRFLITNFELKHEGELKNKYPIKIYEDEVSRIWFKEDLKFKTPKAFAHFYVRTPVPSETAETAAMMDLFCCLLYNILAEDVYDALMADYKYYIKSSRSGLLIEVDGFDEKLPLLLETILGHIVKFDPDEVTFENIKAHLNRGYYNSLMNVEKLSNDIQYSILKNIHWTSFQKRLALKQITRDMLKAFVPKCFEAFFLESLIQGNITKEEALSLNKMVKENLNPHAFSSPSLSNVKTVNLPLGSYNCRVASFNKEDKNSVIKNYYQLGSYGLKSSSILLLFKHFMIEPCFDTLRTQEQLGYDVNCDSDMIAGIFAFIVCVQSPSNKFSCSYVDDRIEVFLQKFLKDVEEISPEKFETQRSSLISALKCDDLSLKDEVDRSWQEIIYRRYVFERREKQINYLENLGLEEYKAWVEQEVHHVPKERKKLSIQIVGPCDESLEKERKSIEVNMETNIGDTTDANNEDSSCIINSLTFLPNPAEKSNAYSITNIEAFKEDLSFYAPNPVSS